MDVEVGDGAGNSGTDFGTLHIDHRDVAVGSRARQCRLGCSNFGDILLARLSCDEISERKIAPRFLACLFELRLSLGNGGIGTADSGGEAWPVEDDQQLPGTDDLIVADRHLGDETADVGRNPHHVGADPMRFAPARPMPLVPPVIRTRLFSNLTSPAMRGRKPKALYFEAAALLDLFVDAVAGGSGEGPIHRRLGRAWGCDDTGMDLIRRSFVLLADHELNASTFAARVTASTGASLAACALAGLAALSGPLHGGMAVRVRSFLVESDKSSPHEATAARLSAGTILPGFGHPLYPGGDPRAQALLAAFEPLPEHSALAATVKDITGELPNIDFALTVLSEFAHLPEDAPFQIFATARCTGWIAHALEQSRTGILIRPRARYVGVDPGTT